MSMRARTSPTPWSALFFALLGLIWCGYIAFPTGNPTPCATSGCAIFRDSKIAGISLWWVGGAYFFLLAIVCLRGNRPLAWLMARVALFLDSLLLVAMFLTAPCSDCLIVALFFGLTFFALRPTTDGWFTEEPKPSLLLPIWFGLFLGNAVMAGNEYLPNYVLGNTGASEVRVYFSPSCPSCREAILSLGNAAALYPVEEKAGDSDAIIRLAALLKANVPMQEALARSLDPQEPVPSISLFGRAVLSIQLVRNKSVVMRQGFRALPLIQVNGMPGRKPAPLEEPPTPPVSEVSPIAPDAAGAADPAYSQPGTNGTAAPAPGAAPGAGQGSGQSSMLPKPPSAASGAAPGTTAGAAVQTTVPQPAQQAVPQRPQPGQAAGKPDHRATGASGHEGAVPDFLQDVSNLGQCKQNSQQPCDDPPQ